MDAGWQSRERVNRPGSLDYGAPYNLPNHPVVGVSWYETLAFCRWLEEQLHAVDYELQVCHNGRLKARDMEPEVLQVRLPSEAEWEKAARSTDGRRYPWGYEPDPNRANYWDAGIEVTSPVGIFPAGASPYGIEDLSGNVWEWTRTLWKRYPYDPMNVREDLGAARRRVLRGGAFDNGARRVRCTCRGQNYPDGYDNVTGFRLVISPVHLDSD